MVLLKAIFGSNGKLIEPDLDYIKIWVACVSQREWTEFIKRKIKGWSTYGINQIF